jgi:hypothetical protein
MKPNNLEVQLDGSAGYFSEEPSNEYVDKYAKSHIIDLEDKDALQKYRFLYFDHIVSNEFMPLGASLLYLGCGTGGFFIFLIGLVRSPELIFQRK